MKKLLSIIACLVLSVTMMMAQKTVTGRVVSGEDGEPIIGASVIVTGTTTGTVTDFDGNFSLKAPESAKTLTVSFVGMESQTVNITGKTLLVTLSANNELLDEVMVVAYGTAKRSAFTGSASTVKAENLEKRQVSNVTNALAGEVAGVQTINSNGQPGTGSTIRVRGVGSINAGASPLYVVDGVPFDGDISSINSADIESLTVLKDAASAALYGARGANGVIMVTTKRGKTNGQTKVSLDAKLGVNQRATRNYDVLRTPGSYMEKAYEALYNAAFYSMAAYKGNDESSWLYANKNLNSYLYTNSKINIYEVPNGQYLIGRDGKLNPNATLGYYDGEYYYTPDNWRDETYESNMRQEYNINVSGGNDKVNYYISLGMLDDKGLIQNSAFKRYSLRANGDYQVTKWLKMGASFSYANSTSRYPGDQTATSSSGNVFFLGNNIAPIYPMYVRKLNAETGAYEIAYDPRGGIILDYADGNTSNYKRPWMPGANPVGGLIYDTERYNMDILSTNWYATINPLEGLTFTARVAADIDNTRYTLRNNPWYGQFSDLGGYAYGESSRVSGLDMQYIANYTKTFADVHNADIMIGYDGYEYKSETLDATGQNLYNPYGESVNNAIDQRMGYGSKNSYSTAGFFGRFNYNYDEKYFGSFSYRRDGSSRFHPDNRWGNFWSASAAWVLSQEDFIKNLGFVDFLKVKASYGEQGNDNVGNYYAYQDQYSMTGSNGVFADGTLSYKGNKELTWEKSQAFNIGVDFNLWSGKLDGSVEYFSRKTSDMLYYKPVANSNGYSQIPMNIGSMTNSGVEFDFHPKIINNKYVTWSVNLNATFLKNEINKLHPDLDGELIDGTRIYSEGESMYRFYLVKYAGVNPSTGEALYWAKSTKENPGKDLDGNTVAEDIEYKTSDWSVASTTNKCATDDLLPTVYGGFGTSVSFYGFDASIAFSYQLGGKIYDSGYASLMHGGSSSYIGQNWHKDILNSWSESNPNSDIPRVNTQDKYTRSTSDRWMISSNYLSLNNITIGYTVPKNLLSKVGLEKVRIYFAADNVALLSKRDGLDPRTSYTSSTASQRYSPIRTLSGGINVSF